MASDHFDCSLSLPRLIRIVKSFPIKINSLMNFDLAILKKYFEPVTLRAVKWVQSTFLDWVPQPQLYEMRWVAHFLKSSKEKQGEFGNIDPSLKSEQPCGAIRPSPSPPSHIRCELVTIRDLAKLCGNQKTKSFIEVENLIFQQPQSDEGIYTFFIAL